MEQQQFGELWTKSGIEVTSLNKKAGTDFDVILVVSSQFDLISFRQQNLTFTRREGDFSTLQVSFNLQRHTGKLVLFLKF